jgi:hypothetical protein
MVRRSLIVALAATLIGTPIASQATTADTSATEQWLIYELNRARWNPWGYAEDHGVTALTIVPPILPQPPLAINTDLAESTGFKAQQTADHPEDFVSDPNSRWFHCSDAITEGTYVCPNPLAQSFGYPLAGIGNVNTIEAYWASGGPNASPGVPPDVAMFLTQTSHIPIMFQWPNQEIGVGWAYGCGVIWSVCHPEEYQGAPNNMSYLFFQIASRTTVQLFITGVVFTDSNGNGIMDLGEGKSGVTVTAGAGSDVSGLGGGYAVPVSPGSYTVTAAGSGFAFQSAAATVGSYNVGIDFAAGAIPLVRSYTTTKCAGLTPTMLGTNGDDILYGTRGRDVIHGLDGNDSIYGLGGDDVICGGEGRDRLYGGAGDDSLYGGKGKDFLTGGPGDDLLDGFKGPDRLLGKEDDDTLDGGRGVDTLDGGPGSNDCTFEVGETVLNC